MAKFKFHITKLLPLALIALALGAVFYFNLDQYLSFSALKDHRAILLAWTATYYWQVVLSFMAIYIVAVSLSLPGVVFLSLAAGFLFGEIPGTIYVVVSATLGATVIFLAVKYAFGEMFTKKAGVWVAKLQVGFQHNAFQYLLFLRLVPLFPFFIVNIVPAILNVRKTTFVLATFIGIIPGTAIYVWLGGGLGKIFEAKQTPNLSIILEPAILLPFIGLAVLALAPILYKALRKNKHVK